MNIRKMTKSDIDEVLSITVAAFYNTELYCHVAPDTAERKAFIEGMFRFRLRFGVEHAETDVAIKNGSVVGAGTWVPPETGHVDHTQFVTGMHELLATFSTGIQERWKAFYSILVKARDGNIQQPYWSLSPVVVKPSEQGQGIASLLIREKLHRIDAEKTACFLATQDAVNVSIYERYGFHTVQKDMLPASSVCSYTMIWRP